MKNNIRDFKLVEVLRDFLFKFPNFGPFRRTDTEETPSYRSVDERIKAHTLWCTHYVLRNIVILPARWVFLVVYVVWDFGGLNGLSKFQLHMFYTMDCWDLADFPLCVRTLLCEILPYYLIQEVIGPMIYWPLRLLQRPILWTLKHLR